MFKRLVSHLYWVVSAVALSLLTGFVAGVFYGLLSRAFVVGVSTWSWL